MCYTNATRTAEKRAKKALSFRLALPYIYVCTWVDYRYTDQYYIGLYLLGLNQLEFDTWFGTSWLINHWWFWFTTSIATSMASSVCTVFIILRLIKKVVSNGTQYLALSTTPNDIYIPYILYPWSLQMDRYLWRGRVGRWVRLWPPWDMYVSLYPLAPPPKR